MAVAALSATVSIAAPAAAQSSDPDAASPERSAGWDSATTIMAVSAAGVGLLMPRIFYSDPEVTVGWKARWHASVLAPSMTLALLTLANEQWFKDGFESPRPGCEDADRGSPGCESFGMFSSHALLSFSALGQGTGVFLVDTFKWSDGQFNAGAFTGNVGIPLVLSVITAVGRTSGNWETAGQVWAGAGVGFASGIGMGLLYAWLQRPECGYTGSLVCW